MINAEIYGMFLSFSGAYAIPTLDLIVSDRYKNQEDARSAAIHHFRDDMGKFSAVMLVINNQDLIVINER